MKAWWTTDISNRVHYCEVHQSRTRKATRDEYREARKALGGK